MTPPRCRPTTDLRVLKAPDFKGKEAVSSTGSVTGRVEFEVLGLVESGLDAFGIEAGAGAGFKSGSAKSFISVFLQSDEWSLML